MKDLIAPVIENVFNLYQPEYSGTLYNGIGYTLISWIVWLTPLVLLFIFYYLWDPILGKVWQWLIIVGVSFLVIGFAVNAAVSEELAIYLVDQETYPDAGSFVFKISAYSAIVGLVVAMIWTAIIKWRSTNNKLNPV